MNDFVCDFSNIPKLKNGTNDWKNSVGCKISVTDDKGNFYYLKIIEYMVKGRRRSKVKLEYDGQYKIMSVS